MDGLASSPIPLPEMLFTHVIGSNVGEIGRAVIPVLASQPPGNPTFTLDATPSTSSTTPDLPVNFQVNITSNFDDDFTFMAERELTN